MGRRGKKETQLLPVISAPLPPKKMGGEGNSQVVWTVWIASRKQLGYLMNDKITLKKFFNW